jgi:hypothetical protein
VPVSSITASSSLQSNAALVISCHGSKDAFERVILALTPIADFRALMQNKLPRKTLSRGDQRDRFESTSLPAATTSASEPQRSAAEGPKWAQPSRADRGRRFLDPEIEEPIKCYTSVPSASMRASSTSTPR